MSYNPPPLPDQQPIIGVDAHELNERHYRRMSVGEPIKTWHEAYVLFPSPHWALTTFWTKDRQRVTGRTHYRAALSIKAYLSLVAPLARKWWTRFTQKTPSL